MSNESKRTIICRDTVVWVPVQTDLGNVLWPGRILPITPGFRIRFGDRELRCVEPFSRTERKLLYVHISRLHEYVSRRPSGVWTDECKERATACIAAEKFICIYGTTEQREALFKAKNEEVLPTWMKLRLEPEAVLTKLSLKRKASSASPGRRPAKLRRCDSGDTVQPVARKLVTPVKLVLRIRKPKVQGLPWYCNNVEASIKDDGEGSDVSTMADASEAEIRATSAVAEKRERLQQFKGTPNVQVEHLTKF